MAESKLNRAWNKIILGLTDGTPPRKGTPQHITADACATSLGAQRRFGPKVVPVREIIGKARWEEVLLSARSAAESKFEHYGRHRADVDAPTLECIRTREVLDVLELNAGKLSDDVEATFLYYQNGEGLPLHLDNDSTYEYNLLTCVEKVHGNGPTTAPPSMTYFYLGDGVVKAASLQPGQGVWFHAGYTPHARSPLVDEMGITLVSIGMRTIL